MMGLSSLIWIVLLILLIVVLVRWLNGRAMLPPTQRPEMSAEEILRQRYARGEIDEATFERMRERLGASPSDPGEPPRSTL